MMRFFPTLALDGKKVMQNVVDLTKMLKRIVSPKRGQKNHREQQN